MSDSQPRAPRLWRNPDFLKLWSGETVSQFGSLISGVAIPFAAILTLDAAPFQMALLRSAGIGAGILTVLFVGVWVDRMRRRPIMIATDLGQAILLATIPIASVAGLLKMTHLYAVTFAAGLLSSFFDVAYRSYLPSIVERDDLVEANSKLSASSSVAEVGAFGIAGWLVQWLTAPFAILIDALSFAFSALCVMNIKRPEPAPTPACSALASRTRDRRRRALRMGASDASRVVAQRCRDQLFVWCHLDRLHAVRGEHAGFQARPARHDFLGRRSELARRRNSRDPCGAALRRRTLDGVRAGDMGRGSMPVPIAHGATLLAGALLVAQQLIGDGGATIYLINATSIRQMIAPPEILGRVSASLRFIGLASALAGSIAGGAIGQLLGLRFALVVGACGPFVAAVALWPTVRMLERESLPPQKPNP